MRGSTYAPSVVFTALCPPPPRVSLWARPCTVPKGSVWKGPASADGGANGKFVKIGKIAQWPDLLGVILESENGKGATKKISTGMIIERKPSPMWTGNLKDDFPHALPVGHFSHHHPSPPPLSPPPSSLQFGLSRTPTEEPIDV